MHIPLEHLGVQIHLRPLQLLYASQPQKVFGLGPAVTTSIGSRVVDMEGVSSGTQYVLEVHVVDITSADVLVSLPFEFEYPCRGYPCVSFSSSISHFFQTLSF